MSTGNGLPGTVAVRWVTGDACAERFKGADGFALTIITSTTIDKYFELKHTKQLLWLVGRHIPKGLFQVGLNVPTEGFSICTS